MTSVVCLVAVACASFAWTAIVYLRTWADPGTPARVVSAVLDDDDARDEVLAPFRAQLERSTEQVPEGISAQAAIDIVLADPATRRRIADAYAPAGGGMQPGAARDALVAALAEIDPSVTERLAGVGPEFALPNLSSISSLRPTAERWAWRIAFVALALFALAFAFGDRALAARRYAWWACGTGLAWWLGPWLIGAAARRWLPSFDATASVVIDAYVGLVRPWAIGLACTGIASFVVALVAWGRRTAATPAPGTPHDQPSRPPPPLGVDDTQPIPVAPVMSRPGPRPATVVAATTARLDDVDVWTAYATPAPDPAAPTAGGTAAAWAAVRRQTTSVRPGLTSPDS